MSLSTTPHGLIRVAGALVLSIALLGVASGCKSIDEPNTEAAKGPVEAPTVEATLSVVATGVVGGTTPTGSVSATSTSKAPGKPWPAKIGTFAKNYSGEVWYPTAVPVALKLDMIDVVEMEPGSGLVCDTVWTDGTKAIIFTQGSPKLRDYEIRSVAKVPWGSGTADVVHEDPTDTSTGLMIVYSGNGTLAELTGGMDIETLKAVAKSMVVVK